MSKYFRQGGTNEAMVADGVISPDVSSPAQITANQNDYNWGGGGIARISTDASRTVTGLVAGRDGQELTIFNVGSFPLVLANESVLSTAANRIITGTGADLTVSAGTGVKLVYDGTSARWRVQGGVGSSSGGGVGEKVFKYQTFA